MRKFEKLEGIAAPYNESDVDTDAIFPARFLLLLNRAGLGKHLFQDLRRAAGGEKFVLDQPEYQKATNLVAGERFGIGSSREHAAWAIEDSGIRCIIAKSFGDIFRQNCFKNGVLPIELSETEHKAVLEAAVDILPIEVDLNNTCITLPRGDEINFEVPEQQRQALLSGKDEIANILSEDAQRISDFEQSQQRHSPWLYLTMDQIQAS